jgi:hypothetical protein
MHRTLFTPSMIETFRLCKRAYELAFVRYANRSYQARPMTVCKQFVLKALADINRGKLTSVHQVQKFMGQNWPIEKLNDLASEKDNATRAFLYAYKTLTRYVGNPYKPHGAQVVAVALKVRARIAHVRVYVEDTIDLVLWYPSEQRLEFVDFQLKPIKAADPSWPSAHHLVKQFLAQKLKFRWPFQKLTMTVVRVGTQDFQPASMTLDDSIFRLNWEELTKTLEEMKEPREIPSHKDDSCQYCQHLQASIKKTQEDETEPYSMTA